MQIKGLKGIVSTRKGRDKEEVKQFNIENPTTTKTTIHKYPLFKSGHMLFIFRKPLIIVPA
jgi:hypothetical protein